MYMEVGERGKAYLAIGVKSSKGIIGYTGRRRFEKK